MAQISKRKEFLIKQGYSSKLIDTLESCGVTKHMLWFLSQFKGVTDNVEHPYDFKDKIKMINAHIEFKGKNTFKNLDEAYKSAYVEEYRKKSALKKAIHTFKDGHTIVLLKPNDLQAEGMWMSNCVGNYTERVSSKERAVLALKNSDGTTLVHFEILKNGALAQNFEKANMPVRNKHWKYVNEFLKLNSKNIPSSKHFGFVWRTSMDFNNKGINISAECVIPKRISKHMDGRGQMVTTLESSDTLKEFRINIPKVKFYEFEKEAFIKKIKEAKSDIIKSLDDIIANVEITDGENLFVSDKMKETLFGEGHYAMKGDGYNLLDLTMFHHEPVEEAPIEAEEMDAAPIRMARDNFHPAMGGQVRLEDVAYEQVERQQDAVAYGRAVNEDGRPIGNRPLHVNDIVAAIDDVDIIYEQDVADNGRRLRNENEQNAPF